MDFTTGITRIKIQSGWNDRRVAMSDKYAAAADRVYRKHFRLTEGTHTARVIKDDPLARYDSEKGIDVFLKTVDGKLVTVQEKFLNYHLHTATFEERKNSGKKGGWYYTTAEYYFVGYIDTQAMRFTDYVLLDLAAMRKADAAGSIHWNFNKNGREGRSAIFRYVEFDKIPSGCVVARGKDRSLSLIPPRTFLASRQ